MPYACSRLATHTEAQPPRCPPRAQSLHAQALVRLKRRECEGVAEAQELLTQALLIRDRVQDRKPHRAAPQPARRQPRRRSLERARRRHREHGHDGAHGSCEGASILFGPSAVAKKCLGS